MPGTDSSLVLSPSFRCGGLMTGVARPPDSFLKFRATWAPSPPRQCGSLATNTQARALYDRAAAILGDASAPGKGRLTIINDTGASMTVSWSGTNTGTQTFSGTVMLPLNKGEYTLNIKTQCGTRTESITIGDEGSKSITFSCRLIR